MLGYIAINAIIARGRKAQGMRNMDCYIHQNWPANHGVISVQTMLPIYQSRKTQQ